MNVDGSAARSDTLLPEPRRVPVASALPTDASRPRKRLLLVAIALAVLAVAGTFAWRVFSAAAAPGGVVQLSGRLEGDDSAIAARTSGRITEIRVREGDLVHAGDIIAVLDDDQVKAREDQARAALTQAEARTRAARDQVAVLEQQLRQGELQMEQAKLDAEGRVGQAEADVAEAQAQLAREQAALQIAMFDKEAYGKLAVTGAVSEREGRQAASTADQQFAAAAAAQKRVDAARGALSTARANLANSDIRAAQSAGVRRQMAQQEAEVASAVASTEQARALLAEAQANRQDLTVLAPFDGTVVTRTAEPGEIVGAGTAILTLVDLNKVYLRGFVPEGRIGEIKVGQPARVYIDSKPDQPIEAFVTRIDPEATFTPENTYFREDRVKQVFGVKMELKGAAGFAKPGMPADGEILVSGSWPSGRRS
jgi:HlyD family secretion protein